MLSPARLTGPHGHSLELEIRGYQFPDIHDDWDANWLVTYVEASDEQETWSGQGPILLTWELRRLAQWIRKIVDIAEDCPDEIEFIEPELHFLRLSLGETTRIFVSLMWEFLPPTLRDVYDGDALVLEFTPGIDGLRHFADGLDEAVKHFPERR